MSKNMKVEEEDWEDVEEEEDEEDEDTTINNSDVVMKYKKAAQWANESLETVVKALAAGKSVIELCKLGDDTMLEKLNSLFRGTDKGLAFPTSISLNNCVCHNSPTPSEETTPQVLAANDVVHIDLGVHIDGYCAVVAHTVLLGADGQPCAQLPADSKEANLITAAYATLNTALRKMRPGATIYEVTEVIEKCAEHFKVNLVEGVLSHQLKRYIIDGYRCIPSKKTAEHMVHDYDLGDAQVWTLDVAMTTGKGKLKERDTRTSIYKIALDSNYVTKMESAREVQKEIDAKFQTFPFAVRNIETKKARLGLSEMLKHNVVVPYPVLYERDGEAVAQFKVTLLITPKKIERITGLPAQKPAAEPAPFTDELLIATSKLPMSLVDKKKK